MIFLICLCLSLPIEPIECELGKEVRVIYSIPAGWTAQNIESSPDWELVKQKNDTITLIPLTLDTLRLPSMACFSDTMSMFVAPPILIVPRTMPDTSWSVAVFPSPVLMDIPPGIPEDYLKALRFWVDWGQEPDRSYLLPILAVSLLAAILIGYFLYRRKRNTRAAENKSRYVTIAERARKLLASPNYADGNWTELYREMEEVLRNITAKQFSILNSALTIYQLKRELGKTTEGKKFLKETDEILREILLQRYAAWGSSRVRSERFIKLLVALAERLKK